MASPVNPDCKNRGGRKKPGDFELVEVIDKTVTQDEEIAALREQLDLTNKRAQLAEKQLNDVVMAASIKLATARMVLSQIHDQSGQLGAAIQGVLDALPRNNAPSGRREQRRLQ